MNRSCNVAEANLAGWKDSRQQELERLRKDEELALASRRNLVKITKGRPPTHGPLMQSNLREPHHAKHPLPA